jgi:hypothetical protein
MIQWPWHISTLLWYTLSFYTALKHGFFPGIFLIALNTFMLDVHIIWLIATSNIFLMALGNTHLCLKFLILVVCQLLKCILQNARPLFWTMCRSYKESVPCFINETNVRSHCFIARVIWYVFFIEFYVRCAVASYRHLMKHWQHGIFAKKFSTKSTWEWHFSLSIICVRSFLFVGPWFKVNAAVLTKSL